MTQPSILVVDDEADNFDVVEAFLDSQGYILHYVASGKAALDCLQRVQPDVILLDLMMPEIDGLEVCQRIKAMPEWVGVPIVMVTALSSKENLSQCLAAGADDFIAKPIDRLELISRTRSMLRIHQQYQRLANFNSQLELIVHERTTQLKTLLDQDALTKLPSRSRLLQHLGHVDRPKNPVIAYIDCDEFKLVNGAFGYGVGNQLLQAIAHRLKKYLRPGDILARIGEDEFCFLLSDIANLDQLNCWIEAVMSAFKPPFLVANLEIFMSICMGIALDSEVNAGSEALLQAADMAMYRAKLRGKNCYQMFDRQLTVATRRRLTLETDLQRALEHQEFVTYYQPIVRLATQQVVGFEALVRWQHPERGLVSPGEFIPCMEETGLVVRVGLVVLQQACEQLQTWHQQGWPDLTMSINLSVRQFASPTLLADIDSVLAATGVNPAYLKLEITESALMENAEEAIILMEDLRSRQIQISVDDFGTGYSSLGYLHRFPIDILKIDQSFVSQKQVMSRSYQVVETILTLGHQLELAVIAEGIETHEQLQWLQSLGCEFGQGYLFAPPQCSHDIETLILSD
ncbi:EAL domain-containing protein [Leptolyngbya sp. PCC 6406]|uniref:two-component system response regulator n=1 Tax=Leptolyngbya sp. PCC 6406 TaxID=1173264 RepID=UPI0002ABD5E4|nr:EAL domain-containing protein [Leptolyngbya sp. PCC 6406]